MDEFNYLFSLFGLLLGFSMAELVGGLGRAIRADEGVRIGWLTPLLALSVTIDIASFWLSVWEVRAAIHAHLLAVLIGTLFCGGYYLIAIQAVPDDHKRWPHFDIWYWRVKRRVALGLIAINLAIFTMEAVLLPHPFTTPYAIANSLYLALLLAIAFVKGRRTNIALLTANILMFAVSAGYGAAMRAAAG
jgi:hypothetical protein